MRISSTYFPDFIIYRFFPPSVLDFSSCFYTIHRIVQKINQKQCYRYTRFSHAAHFIISHVKFYQLLRIFFHYLCVLYAKWIHFYCKFRSNQMKMYPLFILLILLYTHDCVIINDHCVFTFVCTCICVENRTMNEESF